MSMNLVTLLYLLASICFIQALKGLSHPTTSIRGNVFGMTGMAIAVLTTGALIWKLANGNPAGLGYVLVALVVGGGLGAYMANKVEMTKMPELVAFMHSMIGLAAVFIAVAAVAEPHAFNIALKGDPIPAGNRLELFLGAAIGAITFSGSVIALGSAPRRRLRARRDVGQARVAWRSGKGAGQAGARRGTAARPDFQVGVAGRRVGFPLRRVHAGIALSLIHI